MQLQQGLDASPGTAEEHVPPACVAWAFCKDRTCGEHGLPEAQARVEGSKPQCQVGETGQITHSDPQV